MSERQETLAYLCSSWNMEEKEVMSFFENTFKDFLLLIEDVKVAGDAVRLYETWEKTSTTMATSQYWTHC